jgi:hypothetical protein
MKIKRKKKNGETMLKNFLVREIGLMKIKGIKKMFWWDSL